MEIKNLSIYVKNMITFKLSVLTQSILFYPLIFSIIIFIVYIITSRLDHLLFDNDVRVNIPYLDSLLFAGSAEAASSILSAIAGGWTTMLGVTFSVTLVTLQLSTSKYTSHIIHKFENDRINKLTLGWFIAVVLYSLLVLKTVRTDQAVGDIFTPIIGVNVAIAIALISLFIFVLFLNNIGSYLKPRVLVSGLVDQIICSIKPYEKRDIDKKYLYQIKEEKNNLRNIKKLFEIKSKQQGIVRYIDWNTIYSGLQNPAKNESTEATPTNIWIEFNKSLGESVEDGNILVMIYGVDNKNKEDDEKEENKQKDKVDNNKNNNNKKKNKNTTNEFQQTILSSFDINKDRDISRDYTYGIELLKSLAIKSITQKDSDITNSCISGLFRILIYVLKRQEIFGLPFRIITKKPRKKNKNEDFNDKINMTTENYNIEDNNNKNNLIRKKLSTTTENTDNIIMIKPKEKKLSNLILSELSIINSNIFKDENIPVIEHFMGEYFFSSKTLLENDKKNEFKSLTDWYSKILSYSFKSLTKEFQNEVILIPLSDFRNYISGNYPSMKNSFDIYMQDIINR